MGGAGCASAHGLANRIAGAAALLLFAGLAAHLGHIVRLPSWGSLVPTLDTIPVNMEPNGTFPVYEDGIRLGTLPVAPKNIASLGKDKLRKGVNSVILTLSCGCIDAFGGGETSWAPCDFSDNFNNLRFACHEAGIRGFPEPVDAFGGPDSMAACTKGVVVCSLVLVVLLLLSYVRALLRLCSGCKVSAMGRRLSCGLAGLCRGRLLDGDVDVSAIAEKRRLQWSRSMIRGGAVFFTLSLAGDVRAALRLWSYIGGTGDNTWMFKFAAPIFAGTMAPMAGVLALLAPAVLGWIPITRRYLTVSNILVSCIIAWRHYYVGHCFGTDEELLLLGLNSNSLGVMYFSPTPWICYSYAQVIAFSDAPLSSVLQAIVYLVQFPPSSLYSRHVEAQYRFQAMLGMWALGWLLHVRFLSEAQAIVAAERSDGTMALAGRVLRALTDIQCSLNSRLELLSESRDLASLLLVGARQLRGRCLMDFVHEEDRQALLCQVRQEEHRSYGAASEGPPASLLHVRLVDSMGTLVPVQLFWTCASGPTGILHYVVLVTVSDYRTSPEDSPNTTEFARQRPAAGGGGPPLAPTSYGAASGSQGSPGGGPAAQRWPDDARTKGTTLDARSWDGRSTASNKSSRSSRSSKSSLGSRGTGRSEGGPHAGFLLNVDAATPELDVLGSTQDFCQLTGQTSAPWTLGELLRREELTMIRTWLLQCTGERHVITMRPAKAAAPFHFQCMASRTTRPIGQRLGGAGRTLVTIVGWHLKLGPEAIGLSRRRWGPKEQMLCTVEGPQLELTSVTSPLLAEHVGVGKMLLALSPVAQAVRRQVCQALTSRPRGFFAIEVGSVPLLLPSTEQPRVMVLCSDVRFFGSFSGAEGGDPVALHMACRSVRKVRCRLRTKVEL